MKLNRKKWLVILLGVLLLIMPFYKDISYSIFYVQYVTSGFFTSALHAPEGDCDDIPSLLLSTQGIVLSCEVNIPRGADYSLDISFLANRKNKNERDYVRYLVGSRTLVIDGKFIKQAQSPEILVVVSNHSNEIVHKELLNSFYITYEGEADITAHLAVMNLDKGQYKITVENKVGLLEYAKIPSTINLKLYTPYKGK